MASSSSSSQSARPSASTNANEQARSRNSGGLFSLFWFSQLSSVYANMRLSLLTTLLCIRICSENHWAICYFRCEFRAVGSADYSVFCQCLGNILFSLLQFLVLGATVQVKIF